MNIPNGWESEKFEDAFEYMPKSGIKAGEGKEDGAYKFFTSSSEQTKYIEEAVFEGEFLIIGTGGAPSIHHCKGKFSTSTDCWVVKSSKNDLEPKFVYYFFKGNPGILERGFRGAGLKHLSRHHLNAVIIPKPPLATQKKIVALLEKAEKLIGLREEADRLTDEYLKAAFYEMFGDPVKNPKKWPVMNIRNISEIVSDGPFGSNLKSEHYAESGVRVIRLQNIGTGTFIDNDKAYVSESHYEKIKKYTCFPGDVLIATMGDPNLRACVFPNSIKMAIHKADCIRVKPNPNLVSARYLCSLINTPQIIKKASSFMHGQTRTRISMSQVAALEIPIPPVNLQNEFSKISEACEVLQNYQHISYLNVHNLFNSLMHSAFKGELVC